MHIGKLDFGETIIDEGIFIELNCFETSETQFIDKLDAIDIINHLKQVFEIK